MKRAIGTATLVACLFLPATQASAGSRLLKPATGESMWLSVGGKSRLYYRVASGQSTELEVRGEGELKCIVRAVATSASATTIAYSVVVTENGHTVKSVRTETVPSPTKWKGREEIAGKSRSFTLRIPAGDHRLRIVFESTDAAAAGIRYVFSDKPRRPAQSQLHATAKRESVTVLVKERPLDYYLADATSPVEVAVIGPTRLRVVSRFIFPDGARGDQRYMIQLQRDGKPLADKTLVTTKSAVAECESHPAWIFGKSKTFYLDIPKGTHVITLRLANTDSPAVALRFSVPKGDAANGR